MSERSPVWSRLSFSMRAISAFRAASAACADPAFAAAANTRAVTSSVDMSTFSSASADFTSSPRVRA